MKQTFQKYTVMETVKYWEEGRVHHPVTRPRLVTGPQASDGAPG